MRTGIGDRIINSLIVWNEVMEEYRYRKGGRVKWLNSVEFLTVSELVL